MQMLPFTGVSHTGNKLEEYLIPFFKVTTQAGDSNIFTFQVVAKV